MTLDQRPLVVDVRHDAASVAVRLAGELDVSTAPELRDVLMALVADGHTVLDVDVCEMRFIDSTGLGVLVAAQKRLEREGGRIRLVGATASTQKVLDITGLARLFLDE